MPPESPSDLLTMSTSNPGDAVLSSLNKAQYRAVTSESPTVAILAGPGSGKTHTLTARVVWLIKEAGYQPSDVIVATFTVKAAREMKHRIGKLLGEECQKKIVLGTFHSISRRYLATYGKRIGLDPKFGIADDKDSKAIMDRICKRHDISVDPVYARNWISKRKSKGISMVPQPEDKKNPQFPMLSICYQEYQDQLQRSNMLDYDDLLLRCVELLKSSPGCVRNVQAVLIDEYQDTNGIQYQLMKLLAQAKHRITIVGDPDQSIYGWRSAEIRNLFKLLREYPETDEISLEENYRSSQSILNCALRVIQQDKKRYQKVLLPVHAKGATPVLRTLNSGAKEGQWVVSEVRRVTMMCGGMLKNEDVAILIRSAYLSRHVESALGKAGIPYRMIGGSKFYDRKEIKILLDYLRVVFQPDNNDAVARIINVPRRGIGEVTIKALLEEAELSKASLWSLITKHCSGVKRASTNIRANMEKKLSGELVRIINTLRKRSQSIKDDPAGLIDLLNQLIDLLKFEDYLKTEHADDHEQRWANVQELVNLATDFVKDFGSEDEDALPEVENIEQVKEDDVLGRFLANVALASDAQKDDESVDSSSLVTISTIHAAKGLEWPVVFIPAVYDGALPHSRAEDMDEERRLLYVAMTRAKSLLYLSWPVSGSQGSRGNVDLSQFLTTIADTMFAKKGPSFNKLLVDSIAKILGRVAPTDQAVFDKLPEMFSTEDDMFPEDPHDVGHFDDYDEGWGENWRPKKRQMLEYPAGTTTADLKSKPKPGMQPGSDLTMPSLPGFMTAGAHQTAIQAQAPEKPVEEQPKLATAKRGTAKRKADQRSLLGFITKEMSPSVEPTTTTSYPPNLIQTRGPTYPSLAHMHAQPASAAIDPQMAQHQLSKGKTFVAPKTSVRDEAPRKRYANFSSSPARPVSPVKTEEAPVPPVPLTRPATSLHHTTFQSTKHRGVRRPVGMGPAPSMQQLRQPFKPLTINRPGQPAPKRG